MRKLQGPELAQEPYRDPSLVVQVWRMTMVRSEVSYNCERANSSSRSNTHSLGCSLKLPSASCRSELCNEPCFVGLLRR